MISVGFPGTVASLRQQWGRAGRRGHGLAVLVASEDALDQYFMREPRALLGRRVEAAILDHENPRVLDGHVRAAAFEAPLDDRDREVLGDAALERAAVLPELKHTKAGYVWAGRDYPAARVSLRSTGPEAFTIVDGSSGTVLGIVEQERAYTTVHEGAIYLHLGESYRVRALDLETRTALVEPFSGDYYTQAKTETTTAIVEPRRTDRRLGRRAHLRQRRRHRPGGRLPEEARSRPRRASSSSRSSCRRRSSRPRPSGSSPSRGCSRASRRCRGCSARCTPPSTR